MSERTESYVSLSTSVTSSDNISINTLDEKLLKKVCLLIEALIKYNQTNKKNKSRTLFDLKRIPLISLYDYLYRIIKHTKISNNTLIKALIYIDIIHQKNNFSITYYNIHKLLFISIVFAAKYNSDIFLTKEIYAKIGGVSVKELEKLEKKYCLFINNEFYIEKKLFDRYCQNINNDIIFTEN